MSSDLTSKCRTCLSESSSSHQLSEYIDENKLIEMLDCIVPQIDVKTTSQFSNLVCPNCVEKLLIAYKFQQMCIETNKRLNDLLRIEIFETQPKLGKILNPITVESNLILKEYIEDACFESEIPAEFSYEITNSENENIPDNGSGNESNSSNEKLYVLKKRSEQKLQLREEKQSNLHRLNQDKAEDDKNQNVQELDSITISIQKLNGVIDLESTSGVVKQIIDSECENSSDNSEDDILSKSEESNIINTELVCIDKVDKNNKKTKLPCRICGKIFYRPHRLKRHNLLHSLARPHECKVCKYRFATTSSLKSHLAQHNSDIKRDSISSLRSESFECPDCFRRFKKKGSLLSHRKTHTQNTSEAIYTCTVCQQSFTSIIYLTEHITSKHPEAEKYKCDQCDNTFVLHAHLVQHSNRHKGSRNVVCLICEKQFGNSKRLKLHMLTHNSESSYLCNQCGKTFRNVYNLKQHMQTHAVLKKHQCPECPSRFTCKAYLAKHKIIHSNVKPHVCDICGSSFTATTSLRKHKRLHSGERPYKCDQCSMTFAVIYHLRRHMRTHTGEKPYKCKYCERAYAESGDLTKHLRTHVGENTYKCDQCPMAFKYQAELRQHQSQHYKMAQQVLEKE